MKPLTCVLLGSLALNAFIAVAWWRAPRAEKSQSGQAAVAGVVASHVTPAPPPSATQLLALEPAALRGELQRLGLPREAVEALVLARVYARHDARRRELMQETARLPWWQTVAAGPERMSLLTADQRKELRHLAAVARSEALALLGPAALDRDGAMAAAHPYVPEDRAVLLEALVHDYRDMYAMLREEMHGLRTAKDRADEAWIEGQRQGDLGKLLSPAEREIFELKNSPGGAVLASRALTFEPSEAEYRAIAAIYGEFYATHPGGVTVEGHARSAGFDEYPEYAEKIQAALGDARYADWTLGAQRYTATLTRLAPDFGFTAEQVRDSARLLRDTAARSWAIGEDASATVEQKRAALAALAAEARRTLAAQLGPAGSSALLRDTTWIDSIANGSAVRVNNYTVWTSPVSAIRPPRPAPTTRAPRP